jgi:hypothetical protein
LAWLSASYGFTNFAWIWLWLDRDRKLLDWSLLIPIAWITIAIFSKGIGDPTGVISIARTTKSYHAYMALILLVGYGFALIHNLKRPDEPRIDVLWLLAIGVLVQFAWEFALLISGIRPLGFMPLVVNSLLETNLGIPFIYFFHRAVTKRFGPEGT